MRSVPPHKRLSPDALEGVSLKGQYHIQQKISHGGMAWVYRGVTAKGRSIAIKVLFAHLAESKTARERFRREARIQSQWSHPYIVRVIDYIEEDAIVGMVMDWVAGPSLQQLLDEHERPLDHSGIVSLFVSVVNAIAFSHEHQVIHRDLKPSNILLQPVPYGFVPKVADFGIAKSLTQGEAALTASNSVIGTVQYMAPEQVVSSKYIDHRADIYSIGAMLYQLVTGQMMFRVKGLHQWAYCQKNVTPTAPSELVPGLPKPLEFVVMRCLEKEPENRYSDAHALEQALRATGLLPMAEQTIQDSEGVKEVVILSTKGLAAPLASSIHRGEDGMTIWEPPRRPDGEPVRTALGAPTFSGQSASYPLVSAGPGERPHEFFPPQPHGLPLPTDASVVDGEMHTGSPLAVSLYIVLLLCILLGGGYFFYQMATPPQAADAPPQRLGVACIEGERRACYTGASGTRGKGRCKGGYRICRKGAFGVCLGEILPATREVCNGVDDNCNGLIDESFQQKGRRCELKEDACTSVGQYVCRPDQMGLVCRVNEQPSALRTRHIRLAVVPSHRMFELYVLGKTEQKAKKYQFKGRFCFEVLESSRVKLVARGYESCSFDVAWQKRSLTVRMGKQSDLASDPNYCLAPVAPR